MTEPSYVRLYREGVLTERIEKALAILGDCRVCPQECRVNRLEGEIGVCRIGRHAVVSSYGPHFGEEYPLVGENGSGTIFFAHCNLLCVFCQNYDISHLGEGREASPREIAALMVDLKRRGCGNINFVTPSHVTPMILEALPYAIEDGLDLPLVYNCGGYEMVETLALLDGVFDIYMPDFKFWPADSGTKYCGVSDYPERAKAAFREMHRQVGDLVMDESGVAVRGLLVRHLVMPGRIDDAENIARFLADEISPDTYINVMGQYRPCGRAFDFPELSHALGAGELAEAKKAVRRAGLSRLDERKRSLFMTR